MADVRFLIEFDSNGTPVIKQITDDMDKLTGSKDRASKQAGVFQNALQGVFREMGVGDRAATALASGLGRITPVALAITAAAAGLKIQERLTQPLIEADEAATNFLRSKNIEGLRDQISSFKNILQDRESIGFGGTLFSRIRGFIQGTSEALDTGSLQNLAAQAAERADAVRLLKQKEITNAIQDQVNLTGKTLPDSIRIAGAALERDLLSKFQELNVPGATDLARTFAGRITGARLAEESRQTTLSIDAQVRALQLQRNSVNASAIELIEFGRQSQLSAIYTSELARAHSDAIGPIVAATNALAEEQKQLAALNSGRAGVSAFEQLFGVSLQSSRNETAVKLADSFVTVFNQFGRDGRNAAAFRQAFQSLIKQLLATGAPDIEELLVSRGLSSANLERLKANLGSDLRASLEESRQAGQQWGASLEQDTIRVTRGLRDVGNALDQINRQLRALQNAALNIGVNFVASPPRPFGEFLPYMQQQFTTLNQIVETRSPNIDIPVRGLPQQIAGLYGTSGFGAAYTQYQNLTAAIQREQNFLHQNQFTSNYGIQAWNERRGVENLGALQSQLNTLLLTAGSDAYGAQRSGGGGGGGGGSTVMVNIDLRGSTVTPAALDESIIPALERGIIRATGQAPDFRVLN